MFKAATPFVVVILIVLLLQRIVRTVFVPFIPLFVQDTLGTMTGAATYTGIINGATGLATAIAALTITRLGDKGDKMKLALLLTALSLPVTIFLTMTHTIPTFLVGFVIFSFLAGGADPILTSAASERTSPATRGTLFGMLGTMSSLGAMVAPMIGSYISAEYSLRMILIVMPIFTLIQWICMSLVPKEKAETHGKEKQR